MAFSLANENNTGESTANPKTGTIDTGASGTNTQLIVVYVITNLSRSGLDAAPTLGGDSMSQAGTVESTTEGAIEMWYLIDTFTVGRSLTISVPNNSSRTMSLLASSWILPAGKVAVFDDDNQASSDLGSTNPTVIVNFGLAPSIVISGLFTGASNVSGLTAGRVLLGKYDTGNEGQAHQYILNTKDNSNVSMNWVFSTSDDWATIGGSFREIAGGGGGGDLVSMDTVAFADMVLVNGVSISSITSINGVLTGN
jgi:hypothetical protein